MSSADSTVSDKESPGVLAHLGILQGVIQRMAGNSSSAKTWCITLVAAILVVVADKKHPEYAFIALIPTILFLVLDAYYLGLERGFRQSYRLFVEKLHSGQLRTTDLYEVSPKGSLTKRLFAAFLSFSIWPFYVTLFVMILLATRILLAA